MQNEKERATEPLRQEMPATSIMKASAHPYPRRCTMESLQHSTDLFRPSKRRKFYRKRADSNDDEIGALSPPPQALSPSPARLDDGPDAVLSSPTIQPDDGESLSINDILRQRKTAQRRKAGVEFSSDVARSSTPPSQPSLELVKKEEDEVPAEIKAIGNRFAPRTGRITDNTDKHMYDQPLQPSQPGSVMAANVVRTAYIDHELAKRTQTAQAPYQPADVPLASNGTPISVLEARIRNPASQGKLQEIDLGLSAKLTNIARTEAAISGALPPPPPPKRPPKPRIGRNGKPYIPKPRPDRNRRNSADKARDKVVEDLLREARLEVYDDPRSTMPVEAERGDDEEGAADERIAEQFRREYLDALSEKKEKANKMPGTGAGKPGEERPKGPKLGGSRSARAAMKEREEAAAKAEAAKRRR